MDDILPLKKDWFVNLTELYKRHIRLPYSAHVRPDLMDEEIAKLFKESNCFQLAIGIESGDDYIRNSIRKRNISRKQIEDAFGLAKKYGLKTHAFNMIGIPFENKETIMETVKLNALIGTDTSQTSFFYPYPRTELEAVCRGKGLIEKGWNVDYFSDTILKFDSATKEFLFFIKRFFVYITNIYNKIYKLPPVIRPLAMTLADFIFTNTLFCMVANRIRRIVIKLKNIRRKKADICKFCVS